MRYIIENFQGTDDQLIEFLNERNIKKVVGSGKVTLAMAADEDLELAAKVNYTLNQVIQSLPEETPAQASQKFLFQTMLGRFNSSDEGVDLSNTFVRLGVNDLLSQGGMSVEDIQDFLSLGAYYVSIAEDVLGRDATIEDIENEREIIEREKFQARYQELFHSLIQPALQTGTEADVIAALNQAAEEF